MPDSLNRPWRMLLPLGVIVLLALLWTIYWFIASGIAKERFAEERAGAAIRGITLICATESWGGYPFRFEFSCSSPVLSLENHAEFRSSALLLTALAYAPWQIVALVDGPSSFSGKAVFPTRVDHQRAVASLTFDSGRPPRLSADVMALSVEGQGTAAQVMLHTRPSTSGGIDVAVSVKNMNFQPPGNPPLVITQGDLLATLTTDRSLNVERVSLRQETVQYWGSGAIALDAQNRPVGKLDTATNDLDGLLKILGPHLQLTADQQAGLRSMLGLLGNEAKAPLIARDGALYLGPFKLTGIHPLY
jgi:hypothetical protein